MSVVQEYQMSFSLVKIYPIIIIISIIWYLGYARHLEQPIKPPSAGIEQMFIRFESSDEDHSQV